MRKILLPLATVALLAGFGAANATEPTTKTATAPTTLDSASMDNITAGWSDQGEQGNRSSTRTTQTNNSFLSPQINVAALNNISVVNLGTLLQGVGQANSQGNANH
jgi:hypothetical protein